MVRSVVDPLTRIEGHLRVEIEVEDGAVTDAWLSGGLFRGMEIVLQGRDPADAFYVSQRICGVCPVSHGHASTLAAEEALGVTIPNGARIVRNLIEGAQFLHSHILWFYTLAALDYIDPAKALKADIEKTYALAIQSATTTADFAAVQSKLKALFASDQRSIFTNGWVGHPAYAKDMPPELALIAVAHYLEALEVQADAARVIAIAGGKFPHFMTSLPGGTAFVPTEEKLDDILFRFQRIRDFVHNTMIPDTLAIAPYYIEALAYGGGHGNLLSWGVFHGKESLDRKDRYLPEGAIFAGSLSVQDTDPEKVMESVSRAWFTPQSGNLNPAQGRTDPAFDAYDTDAKYTWAKAARYENKPMEAGPLSRMLVAYLRNVAPVRAIVDSTLERLKAPGRPEVLVSLLGRVAARNLETAVIADWALEWTTEMVAALKAGDATYFADATQESGEGIGLWEAPRGALGHWMSVDDNGRIDRYQVVTPSTWDCGPRDENAVRGVVEQALIGTPIADVARPLEACRVVRSFDP